MTHHAVDPILAEVMARAWEAMQERRRDEDRPEEPPEPEQTTEQWLAQLIKDACLRRLRQELAEQVEAIQEIWPDDDLGSLVTRRPLGEALLEATKWDRESSWLWVGKRGCGKSIALAFCGMREAFSPVAPRHVTYYSIEQFADPPEHPTVNEMCTAPLLLLDEIHAAEKMPGWQVLPIRRIIDERYRKNLTTLGAATCTEAELRGYIGGERVDRFDRVISVSSTRNWRRPEDG